MRQRFKILGTGAYLPATRLSDADIDLRANLPKGWTRKHSGVIHRHECRFPESLGSMAEQAIIAALQDARVDWDGIDLLIDASTCREQPIPCNAALIKARFGSTADQIPCFDVGSTCLSFVVALHLANSLFSDECYRRILIVSSEAALAGVNWAEQESATIFGDGAAAVVLERCEPGPGFYFTHETHSAHAALCEVKGGGHGLPPYAYHVGNDADFRFHMDGPGVFRVARDLRPPMIGRLLAEAGMAADSVQVVPHPASPASLRLMRRLLGFPPEHYHQSSIARHGNLIAAGIPYVLDLCRRSGAIHSGDMVLLMGTSAGYSQAALLFRL
ncbi:MAG: hypothetical protein IT576_20570 [Verrucomicrobiales bacterium]|nr:hypothetical protein [Verrucomicrobiales bacterium]